ncbi:MAG: hypothetical protein N3F09_06970 [Bacteroidia bacterium]|nr:hypothetical protein [Bacteroidia bacterium]
MKKFLSIIALVAMMGTVSYAGNPTDDKDKKAKKEACKKDEKACAGEKKEGCAKEGKSCCRKKAEAQSQEQPK